MRPVKVYIFFCIVQMLVASVQFPNFS